MCHWTNTEKCNKKKLHMYSQLSASHSWTKFSPGKVCFTPNWRKTFESRQDLSLKIESLPRLWEVLLCPMGSVFKEAGWFVFWIECRISRYAQLSVISAALVNFNYSNNHIVMLCGHFSHLLAQGSLGKEHIRKRKQKSHARGRSKETYALC